MTIQNSQKLNLRQSIFFFKIDNFYFSGEYEHKLCAMKTSIVLKATSESPPRNLLSSSSMQEEDTFEKHFRSSCVHRLTDGRTYTTLSDKEVY